MRQLNKERRDKMQPKKPMETNVRKNDSLVATTIIIFLKRKKSRKKRRYKSCLTTKINHFK